MGRSASEKDPAGPTALDESVLDSSNSSRTVNAEPAEPASTEDSAPSAVPSSVASAAPAAPPAHGLPPVEPNLERARRARGVAGAGGEHHHRAVAVCSCHGRDRAPAGRVFGARLTASGTRLPPRRAVLGERVSAATWRVA